MSIKPMEFWHALDKLLRKSAHTSASSNPQNSASLQKPPEAAKLASTSGSTSPILYALLEDIRSLWNVGSIFRTADGAGVSHLYLCGITGVPPRKEIAKTSLGAEDVVPWSYHPYAVSAVREIKSAGIRLIGLERTIGSTYVKRSRPLSELLPITTAQPICLAVGNEVTGLSAEILSACDEIAELPMLGVKESLNVAVAFGAATYLFRR
jgi:23S rRNA (guanosine2251-2'-O)-methyltransferase